MDVLTSETCWALNNEIIKQVTSSWSLFIHWDIIGPSKTKTVRLVGHVERKGEKRNARGVQWRNPKGRLFEDLGTDNELISKGSLKRHLCGNGLMWLRNSFLLRKKVINFAFHESSWISRLAEELLPHAVSYVIVHLKKKRLLFMSNNL